jgi:hypothetical protein
MSQRGRLASSRSGDEAPRGAGSLTWRRQATAWADSADGLTLTIVVTTSHGEHGLEFGRGVIPCRLSLSGHTDNDYGDQALVLARKDLSPVAGSSIRTVRSVQGGGLRASVNLVDRGSRRGSPPANRFPVCSYGQEMDLVNLPTPARCLARLEHDVRKPRQDDVPGSSRGSLTRYRPVSSCFRMSYACEPRLARVSHYPERMRRSDDGDGRHPDGADGTCHPADGVRRRSTTMSSASGGGIASSRKRRHPSSTKASDEPRGGVPRQGTGLAW